MSYLPGFVGLNNLGRTDYVSAVLHALSHVRPLRDFFLEQRELLIAPAAAGAAAAPADIGPKNALVVKFGEVIRKMWSAHNFKSVVSPQEFLHVSLHLQYLHRPPLSHCLSILFLFLVGRALHLSARAVCMYVLACLAP
jgi:U4/U6.U5 tri-snRNP-associated protein 2